MVKELGKSKRILCIYHGNCADGFSAAWVVNKWAKEQEHDIEFHAGVYGEDAPDCNFRHVLMVDFSYDEDTIVEMSQNSASITILDHHKTAQEALANMEDETYCPSTIVFDMEKAGCQLTWEHLFENEKIPGALEAVADRDLWIFAYPYTKEITSYVFSMDKTFENWDFLMNDENLGEVIERGETLLNKQSKDVDALFDAVVEYKQFGEDKIAVANVPWMFGSDLGNKMCNECEDIDYAVCYFKDKDGQYQLSFRSKDEMKDASVVAKRYGGGGHRNACGAKISYLPWEKSYIQIPISEGDGEAFRIMGANGSGSIEWTYQDQNGHTVDVELFGGEDEN